jgi:hypothetical protein
MEGGFVMARFSSAMEELDSETAIAQLGNERCERWAVKADMDRVKVALVSLLPVLWLMASGQSLAGPCSNCSTASTADLKFALKSGKRCSSDESGSIDLSARRANARIGSHSARSNFFPIEPTISSRSVDRRFLADFSSLPEGSVLATRWQFDYRAAAEPRAPSSVS